MHTAGKSDPCSLSDLPSITWMLLGRRWGSHFSSSSAHTRRRLAGTMISSGHSSCKHVAALNALSGAGGESYRVVAAM